MSATVLLAALVNVVAAPGAQADGVAHEGNKKCSDLVSGTREFKIESPKSGNETDGTLAVALSVYNLTADDPDHSGNQTGSEVFDFSASGGVVVAVAVKGGPNTNFYDYGAGTPNGKRLHAPLRSNGNDKFPGLSHISFCYVPKAKPKIRTQVSHPEINIGGSVTDTAHLTEGRKPSGTITFKVYGPDDANCYGTPAFTTTVQVNDNGAYPSAAFSPTAVGTYRWIASYGGDWRNEPVSGACNDPYEQVVVKKAKPKIRTQVSKSEINIGDSVTDTAHLSEGYHPTGTITFKVYGPDDANCYGTPAFTTTVTVNGNGSYPSAAFSPTAVGTYRWIASYSGDARNEPATGACNDPYEQVVVKKAKPKIRTQVSKAEITIGDSVTDTAHLSEGYHPTGTVAFKVYGPDDATCAKNPVFTTSVPVNGNGSYPSAAFTPAAVGTYRWIASYSGDARNEPATGACNDPYEQVVVKKAKPKLDTVPYVLPNDTATLAGMVGPSGGTIVFKLFGNATCSGNPIYVEPAQAVNANGTYRTSNTTVRVDKDSTIGWIVEYSGDAKNEAVTSGCSDEQVRLDFTPLGS